MKKEISVLSLFDGISTLYLALQELNYKCKNYYASEIDADAIAISNFNFPNIQHIGDVSKWKDWDIDWSKIDLVAGGSPCQSFSIANQGNEHLKQGFEGKSNLVFYFFEILDYIKIKNPNVKFLLENVKMKAEWRDIITERVCVEPVLIDSALVSAQHRERYYWCNWDIQPLPTENKILLKDIVGNYSERYYLSYIHHKAFLKSYNWKCCPLNGKGKTILASYYKQPPHTTYIPCEESPSGFRRLTPVECERMQTLPDNFTMYGINDKIYNISDSGRYKAIGNGWTCEVIKHILKKLF